MPNHTYRSPPEPWFLTAVSDATTPTQLRHNSEDGPTAVGPSSELCRSNYGPNTEPTPARNSLTTNVLPTVGTRRAVSAAGPGVFFPSPADRARPVPTGGRCRPAPRCAAIHRSRCVWIYRIYGFRPQGGRWTSGVGRRVSW